MIPHVILVLGWAMLGISFLLPGHYLPWTTFEQQAMAAVGSGVVACVVLLTHAARRVSLSFLAICLYVCAAVPLIQWLFGKILFTVDAVLAASYLTAFATTVVIGGAGSEAQRRSLIDGLGLVLIGAGIASTGLAAMQWLAQGAGIWVFDLRLGGRPYANLAQPNHLSTLLALAIMATLKRFEQRSLDGRVAAMSIIWFGFGIAMTQSRTGWLFVALLVLWCAAMSRRAGLRLSVAAVVCGAAAFWALAAKWDALSQMLLLPSGLLEERLHVGTRWLHWQALWDSIGRAPWFGYGWQQVSLAQQATALDHQATGEWLTNSHNLLLDLLIWNGVPLGLLLFSILVFWFVRQIIVCRTGERWAMLGSVGVVFTHALLEYPLDYTYFLLPTGFMMGALKHDSVDGNVRVEVSRTLVAALLVGQFGLLIFIGREYVQVQEATRDLRFMLARIGSLAGTKPPPPDVHLLDAPREYHRFWLVEVRGGMPVEQLAWMHRVSQRYPVPPALLRYALAAGLNKQPDAAVTALGHLCKMHVPARCDEGRTAWAELQSSYPELRAIPAPSMP